jgi:hypothetical protein
VRSVLSHNNTHQILLTQFILIQKQAVPRVRWLISSISPRRCGLVARSQTIPYGIYYEQIGKYDIFMSYFLDFLLSVLFHRCPLFIFHSSNTDYSLRRTDPSSRGVLPSVVCLSVIVKPRKMRRPRPPRDCRAIGEKKHRLYNLIN